MEQKVIVAKFGGSSMADSQAIKRSAQVAKDFKADIVVVSATSGTTNQLIELSQKAESGDWDSSLVLLKEIKERHLSLANEFALPEAKIELLENTLVELETLAQGVNLLKDCTPKAFDSIQSIGERLSSVFMAQALSQLYPETEVDWFDARRVLRTDSHFNKAVPDIDEVARLCHKHLIGAKYHQRIFVTQGFIGSDKHGATTTLGRGGSDYSAALIAEGIGADELQIWTDVAGIATTDPRIVKEARPIEQITFREAAELATFGGKILHPSTLTPALRGEISVFVGSSIDSKKCGTWIKKSTSEAPLIRAMAIRTDQALITLTTPKMLHAHGFLAKIFNIFDRHRISIDSITTSEISVALTVDNNTIKSSDLMDELSDIGEVKVEEDLSIVSLIGNNINYTPGLAANIFRSLDSYDERINVRMICQGASKHNFCFMVNQEQSKEAIRRLHKTFIEEM